MNENVAHVQHKGRVHTRGYFVIHSLLQLSGNAMTM